MQYGLVENSVAYVLTRSILEQPEKAGVLGMEVDLKALVPYEPTKIVGTGRNYPESDIEILPENPHSCSSRSPHLSHRVLLWCALGYPRG